MIENVGRKVILILTVLIVSIVAMVVVRPRLGLDLRGGTRVVLRIPFEKAVAQQQITQAELSNKRALIEQMIEIYRARIDPDGVKEPQITPEGEDRIVIELPSVAANTARQATAALANPISATDRILQLAAENEEALKGFPAGGGWVLVQKESILYERRTGNELVGLTRGAVEPPSPHEAGATVVLKETDDLVQLLTSTGELHFYIGASEDDFERADTDRTTEEKAVKAWMAAHPEAKNLEAYNALPRDQGGPPSKPKVRWFTSSDEREAEVSFAERHPIAVVEDEDPNWRFSGSDLVSEGVGPQIDEMGHPAVAFKIVESKSDYFGDFTDEHENDPMAIVINSEIVTMPTINERLPGEGIIKGGGIAGFKQEEVDQLVTVLRSGSLRIRPEIESQERVGATLGEESIRNGTRSAIVSLVVVFAFMIAYYRRLGVLAAISLVANIAILLGVMSFWQATLTLPGIAGIILTMGMAVDSNILIYERIREEQLRGRKPLQAAKDGFAHASATIVDSNLTTLVSGIVLYVLGSGPVRGFATTLCVGILTTMFAALLVTRVLVHFQLKNKKIEEWKMARWISDPKIRFMAKAKPAIALSLIVIVAGLITFFSLPDREKLGIEFVGGVNMKVRTEAPLPTQEIRQRVASIPGTIGETSEVKALLASGGEEEGYNEFRITFKSVDEAQAPAARGEFTDTLKDFVEGEIRNALSDVLEKGPYEISVQPGTPMSTAIGTLYFERPHPVEDLKKALGAVPIEEVTVEKVEGPIAAYRFEGKVPPDRIDLAVGQSIEQQILIASKDSQQQPYLWAQPIGDISTIGAAVVSELRDKALLALVVSLFAIVMYIRVRFAEYSYGIAAVVALIHDVLVTLSALAFVVFLENRFGITLVDAEINLSTIAAFLTLIGYSVNDTVVTFDRVRENLPRMKASLYDVLDISINQTLSRTILTAGTVFLTVMILLAFNFGSRNVLESFSFAMLVGVIAGTYSSVFIAAPVLLWLENRRARKEGGEGTKVDSTPLRPHPKAQTT